MNIKSHPFPALPVRVLHLRGSDRQIGRQHAEALGDTVRMGMPKLYYDFWKRLLGMRPEGFFEGMIQKAAVSLIDPLLGNRLRSRIPPVIDERIRGMVDVTSASYEELITTVILPDLLPMLQALLVQFQPATFIPPAVPRFGCTSFVSNAAHLLHGRNLDFPGVSYWDRYPVIQAIERKGALRYIGFASAGVPIGGITGINEEKLSVSLHQHYCRNFSLNGTLPFAIAEEILGSASSLSQALELIRSKTVATSWAFIVVDGKTRTGFVCECQPGAYGVRYLSEEGVLAHSNYFQSAECLPMEYATSARMNWDNFFRRARLSELVQKAGDGISLDDSVRIIGDNFDPFWGEEKIINRTISQLYNIQSLVIDYDAMTVWLAEGDSPVHLRDYHEYDLGAIFAGQTGKTGRTLPGFRFKAPGKESAKQSYVLSFVAAFDGDLSSALSEARRSLDSDFCPEVAQVAAVLALKLGDEAAALSWLSEAREHVLLKCKNLAKGSLPPEYFEVSIFLARSLDLAGKRQEALAIYREVESHPSLEDEHLRRIAKRAPRFSRRALGRILMPYSSYIPFE